MVINVTQAAYAIPPLAIAVAVVRLAMRRRSIPTNRSASVGYRRRSSPLTAAVVGALGLLFGGAMFARADADLQTFRNSPSCRAGLMLAAPLDGTCSVSSATIASSYVSSGRGSATHVVLAFPDGRSADVIEANVRRGAPVRGFRQTGDRNATVQEFRGRVILVQTLSGSFETSDMPYRRMTFWALIGIVLGVASVVAAVTAAFAPGRARTDLV